MKISIDTIDTRINHEIVLLYFIRHCLADNETDDGNEVLYTEPWTQAGVGCRLDFRGLPRPKHMSISGTHRHIDDTVAVDISSAKGPLWQLGESQDEVGDGDQV